MSDPLPTLVGEQNPYSLDPDAALLPVPRQSAGARLARILGLSRSEYLRRFRRANLVDGTGWSERLAEEKARWVLGRDQGAIVLLGRRVARTFRRAAAYEGVGPCPDEPFFTREGRFYLLPHPSGLCRAWNDPGAAERARRLLVEFLP